MENVKGLVNHDKGRTLDIMIETLNDIGYTVDFEVLNSKYFGVPQNRERIFIVAIRDDLIEQEKWSEEVTKGQTVVPRGKRRLMKYDWLKSFNFDWPEQSEVTTRLRDILEPIVDEKYYLDEKKTAKLVAQLEDRNQEVCEEATPMNVLSRGAETKTDGTSYCLKAGRQQELIEPKINVVGRLELSKNDRTNRVHSVDGISPTPSGLGQGGGTEPKIAEPQMLGHVDIKGNDSIKRTYSTEGISPTLTTMGGGHREPKIAEEQIPKWIPKPSEINRTLRSGGKSSLSDKHNYEHIAEEFSPSRYRIRKLTPLECWRLQGFPDGAHESVKQAGISDSQRYRQAGNAVSVPVIYALGERLVKLFV